MSDFFLFSLKTKKNTNSFYSAPLSNNPHIRFNENVSYAYQKNLE